MKRFTLAVVAISGCVLGPACQSIVGIEDRVEATGEDASTSPDTGAPDTGSSGNIPDVATDPIEEPIPSKGCPKDCMAVAPAGWKGPSAFYDGPPGTKPAQCPSWYTELDVDGHQDMTVDATTCDCGTPKITGRSCTATFLTYTNSGCTSGEMALAKLSGCATNNDLDVGVPYKLTTPSPSNGTCTYPNATTTASAPTFGKVDVACSMKTPAACAEKSTECVATPVPDNPAFARLCVWKDGPAPCLSEDYPKSFTVYRKVDDTRSCSPCTGTASAATCGTQFGFRGSVVDCAFVPSPTNYSVNTCYVWSSGGKVLDTGAFQPASGTCTTTPGTPTGKATSSDEVTFCCNF